MSARKSSIYVSSGAFKAASVSALFELSYQADILNLELSSGLQWSPTILDEVRNAKDRCSLLVHNYFPPPEQPFVLNLASKDPAVVRQSREHCRRAIDLCAEIKAPFYSVHSGYAFDVEPSLLGKKLSHVRRFPLDEAKKIFIESLQGLCEYGHPQGIDLLIENNVVAPMNLIDGKNCLLLSATDEDLLEIRERVGSKHLFFLVDFGHVKVTSLALGFAPTSFTRTLADGIRAFHLSDNDGFQDSNDMFDEKAWFLPMLKDFRNQVFVIESYRLEISQIKKCVQTIENAL